MADVAVSVRSDPTYSETWYDRYDRQVTKLPTGRSRRTSLAGTGESYSFSGPMGGDIDLMLPPPPVPSPEPVLAPSPCHPLTPSPASNRSSSLSTQYDPRCHDGSGVYDPVAAALAGGVVWGLESLSSPPTRVVQRLFPDPEPSSPSTSCSSGYLSPASTQSGYQSPNSNASDSTDYDPRCLDGSGVYDPIAFP